jgi:hypothetical protein
MLTPFTSFSPRRKVEGRICFLLRYLFANIEVRGWWGVEVLLRTLPQHCFFGRGLGVGVTKVTLATGVVTVGPVNVKFWGETWSLSSGMKRTNHEMSDVRLRTSACMVAALFAGAGRLPGILVAAPRMCSSWWPRPGCTARSSWTCYQGDRDSIAGEPREAVNLSPLLF